MFVSHEMKAIYLHNPKCAGISISKTLEQMGFVMIETKAMPHRPSIIRRHRWEIPTDIQSYFTFTSVRHPLDRMISGWAYGTAKIDRDIWRLHGRRLTFEEAANLKNFPLPLQKPYIQKSEFCIRFEHLNDDFNKLPFLKNPISLPHKNTTERKHWKEYFGHNQKLLDKCVEMWAEDFEILHYKIPRITFM